MVDTRTDSSHFPSSQTSPVRFEEASSGSNKTLSTHRWANWIAGFSGDFVQSAIKHYIRRPQSDSLILDPFAGVGTTLVEAGRAGVNSVGFEINPFPALVARVKLEAADAPIAQLQDAIRTYAEFMNPIEQSIASQDRTDSLAVPKPRSSSPPGFTSRIPFFSGSIEAKVLHTLDFIQDQSLHVQDIFRVALASVLVEFSNYTTNLR
jgi:hypothetical protein